MSLEKKIYIPIVRKRKKKKKKKIVCLNYYFSSTRLGKKLSSYFIRSGQKQKSNLVYFKLLFKLKQLQPKSSPTFIIKKALINTGTDEILYILATYTGMLEVRKLLTGKKIL